MSWSNITGEQNLLPSGGYGVQDEIKFEANKGKKIRLLLDDGEEPYSFMEHCLEVVSYESGKEVRTFRTIRCPQTHKNPNAECPLCRGQQVRRRIRHACRVWDYDEGKVQKLCAGEAVFKPIATTMKMGINILNVDWAIMKTGTDRNSTEYTCTNLGQTQFQLPEGAPHYNMEQEYAPHSIEEMKNIVEGAGGNWEKLITPPELVYPTLAEALEHEMPNGKYKGRKFKDIWEEDKSQRGYINFLAVRSERQNEEKACAQVILVRLGGAQIDGVPRTDEEATMKPHQVDPTPQNRRVQEELPFKVDSPSQQPAQTQQLQPASRDTKIQEINKLLSSKDKYIKGGFNEILKTMQECSGGKSNITDFTDGELDKMLEACRNA